MPRFIGNTIGGAREIQDNAPELFPLRIRLTYAQAALLPAEDIEYSLDTSDRGGPGSLAKRWYRWFASADAIEACAKSTANMMARISRVRTECPYRLAYSQACPSKFVLRAENKEEERERT